MISCYIKSFYFECLGIKLDHKEMLLLHIFVKIGDIGENPRRVF